MFRGASAASAEDSAGPGRLLLVLDVRDVVVRLGRGRGAELLNLGIGAAEIILGDLVRGFEEQGLEQEPGF